MLPVVAVVGRPNVGKSTLVNRVVGRRAAVVEEVSGVTRDRREFVAEWSGRSFLMIDTGGWQTKGDELALDISAQAEAAVATADVVVFVADATTEVTEDDLGVVKLLHSHPSVVLAVNKVDGPDGEASVAELWKLGLGEPRPISALHGRGVGDLLDAVLGSLPKEIESSAEDTSPRLAIVGRPNVGKSTLLNRLAGANRVLVSPVPGTTRDPIDIVIELGKGEYRVIDTAGIRRSPKLKEPAEFYSVQRARQALAEADVAILVIDGSGGVGQQDQRIAQEAASAGTALVLLLNKWDLVDDDQRELTERSLVQRLGFVGWAPVLRGSAATGARMGRLGEAVDLAVENSRRRISTGVLNRLVRRWQEEHPPPVRKGRRPHILYAVQAGVRPPTIALFVAGGEIGDDYLRFVENRLRAQADFTGTPVHVLARRRQRRKR